MDNNHLPDTDQDDFEDEQITGWSCDNCSHQQQDDYECEKCASKAMSPIWE